MSEVQIFVMNELSGQESGAESLSEIKSQISKKQLRNKHLVRRSDGTKWFKAGDVLVKVFDAVDKLKIEKKERAKKAIELKKARKKRLAKAKSNMNGEPVERTPAYELPTAEPVVFTCPTCKCALVPMQKRVTTVLNLLGAAIFAISIPVFLGGLLVGSISLVVVSLFWGLLLGLGISQAGSRKIFIHVCPACNQQFNPNNF